MERARVRLPSEARLVATAPNPCMNLVALLCCERAPARGAPGLNPAQLAMRQRMLAIQARRMGAAAPAAPAGAVERGPALKLALWRTGSSDAALWEVPISPPDFGAAAPHGPGTKEALAVTSLTWSPDGERLALTLDGLRTSADMHAHAAALQLFSVYDGAVLHTHALGACSVDPCTALWLPYAPADVPSQALDMLAALAPLPALAPVAPEPRPLAARQPAGAHSRPSAQIPRGTGALARVPALPGRAATSLLAITDAHATHLFLDGTICLGSVPSGGGGGSTLIGGDATELALLAPALVGATLRLPLVGSTQYAVSALAQLSTAVHTHLAYACDACEVARHAWMHGARPKAAEWRHHMYDVSKRHASDVRAELMLALVTGSTAPASEQLLLHNMTEGITLAMERDARQGLKTVRRMAGTGVVPACERLLILLHELRGCALWTERFDMDVHVDAIRHAEASVQTCLAVALALAEHAEMELVALDEFFKWWRMEQDRQEKFKLGDDAPRPVPCHDTLTVLEFLQRGFIAPELDAILGRPAPPPPPRRAADESDDSDTDEPDDSVLDVHYEQPAEHAPAQSAADAAEETLAWLAAPPAAAPAHAQVAGVFAHRALFVPSSSDFRAAALPGDQRTLGERLEGVAHEVAHVLAPVLARTAAGSRIDAAPPADVPDVRTDDAALRSAAAGMPAPPPAAPPLVRRAPPHARTAALLTGASGVVFVRMRADGAPVGAQIAFPGEHVVDAAFASADELVVLCRGAADVVRGVSLVPLEFEPLGAHMRMQTSATTFETPIAQYDAQDADAFAPSALAVHDGRRVTLLGGGGKTLAFIAV